MDNQKTRKNLKKSMKKMKIWVKYQNLVAHVSTANCNNVGDFIEAVKKDFVFLPVGEISLSLEPNGEPFAPTLSLSEMLKVFENVENTAEKPLYISVKGM